MDSAEDIQTKQENTETQKQHLAAVLQSVKMDIKSTTDLVLNEKFAMCTKDISVPKPSSALGFLATLLQGAGGASKPEIKVELAPYFQMVKTLLYGSVDTQAVIRYLAQSAQGLGVCAKVMKAGDVAWKCEDCEKDPTCIICQECFQKGDHTGHKVWLKTNVSGCCDCGDPDGWEEKGFCSDHKGFAASSEAMLSSLPPYISQSAPEVYRSLAKTFKSVLLGFIQAKDNMEQRQQMKSIIQEIISFLTESLEEVPANIYFIGRALTEIFVGDFKLDNQRHKCCHRYFIDDEACNEFLDSVQKQALKEDQSAADSSPEKIEIGATNKYGYCTCTVLDLIFQAHIKMPNDIIKSLNQMFITLFQTFYFKMHLAMAYVANMKHTFKMTTGGKSLNMLGVQVLTIDECVIKIVKDEELVKSFIECLTKLLDKAILDPKDTMKFYRVLFICHDLKYMAKPVAMPTIIGETRLLDRLILMVSSLHYVDLVTPADSMEEYGDNQSKLQLVQLELDVCSRIQKYLKFVTEPKDIERILRVFIGIFSELNEKLEQKRGQGFFLAPIHRLFGYFLTRNVMKGLLMSKDQTTSGIRAVFRHFSNKILLDENRKLTFEVLNTFAVHQGFITEVKAKKWIYKGSQLQQIPILHQRVFKEMFLADTGLLQMMIATSSRPSEAIEVLIKNFGTDMWLPKLIQIFMNQGDTSVSADKFQECPRFDVEKLALQVQGLLLRLVHLSILETSFLYCLKDLSDDELLKNKVAQVFKDHLKREVMHNLFLQGANTSIDKIKKLSERLYVDSDSFMDTVVELSKSQTDNFGNIIFRLKDDKNILAWFDPYYVIQEKQQSLQQAAYTSLHKDKPFLNNIVGDYQQNYKYQTPINSTIRQAMASSPTVIKLLTNILKCCLDTEDEFVKKLFPITTFYLSLKLMIQVVQNLEADTAGDAQRKYIQETLPVELLLKFCESDKKLKEIGVYLANLIQKNTDTEMKEEQKQEETGAANKNKTAQLKKKKMSMIAKMKAKQKNFMGAKQTEAAATEEAVKEEESAEQEIQMTCAACQENCEVDKFFERQFVQLGYATKSKLLFHTYKQTVENQKRAQQNLQLAMTMQAEPFTWQAMPDTLMNEEVKEETSAFEEEEQKETKEKPVDKISESMQADNKFVLNELGLKGVIKEESLSGVCFSKCCHYFHYDCLNDYIVAENSLTVHKVHMKQMVGIEDMIQCPICKGVSNTYQPFLPLSMAPSSVKPDFIAPYISFLSQLIMIHANASGLTVSGKPKKIKEILQVDIEKDPITFLKQLEGVVAHSVLQMTTLKYNQMLQPYDSTVQQDDLGLRDLVFILLTARRVLTTINETTKGDIAELDELGVFHLMELNAEFLPGNPFLHNYGKFALQIMFALAFMIDGSDADIILLKSSIDCIYAAFKGQVLLSHKFKQNFSAVNEENLKEYFSQENIAEIDLDEDLIQMQLNFLRTLAAGVLVIKAVSSNLKGGQKEDIQQLGLDQEFLKDLRSQVDDTAEFELLASYLKLDTKFRSTLAAPSSLLDLEDINPLAFGALNALGFTSSGKHAIGVHLGDLCVRLKPDQITGFIQMPPILYLLTPYYTFNFVQLPGDFQTMVREYYTKQCRNCQKQLQNNAICLLCGETMCFMPRDGCCHNLPGMLTSKTLNLVAALSMSENKEGELSYHARTCEGGNSIFIIPQTAEVYMIDLGRISKVDSFYRNQLGETYSDKHTKKWENYYLDEKCGGQKVMEVLKKLYISNKLSNRIIQDRQKKESVIKRHIF